MNGGKFYPLRLPTHCLLLSSTGTVYIQTTSALLIVSGFCVYSVASALFMFPIMHKYYSQALIVSVQVFVNPSIHTMHMYDDYSLYINFMLRCITISMNVAIELTICH